MRGLPNVLKHIVLEGLPGVGKTTFAAALAKHGTDRGTPVGVVPETVSSVANTRRCSEYLTHDCAKLRLALELLRSGASYVVHDRSWVSTLAYSKANHEKGIPESHEIWELLGDLNPDDFLFLYLQPSDIRYRRYVGIADEMWDDDLFAERWDQLAKIQLDTFNLGGWKVLPAKPSPTTYVSAIHEIAIGY